MKRKPYPEYKASGGKWLGQIPAHWDMKRLRFASIVNPTKSEISALPLETEVSFITMENIGTDGSLVLDDTRTIGEVNQGYSYCRDEDVIVASITPGFENGKTALCERLHNGIAFGSLDMHVLRAEECMEPRFLYWLTTSNLFRNLGLASMSGVLGQQRITDDSIKDFLIPVPSIIEQQVISDFLDRETEKIDVLIEKRERLISLLEEKRTAIISKTVIRGIEPDVPMKESGVEWMSMVPAHWELKKIKHLCMIKRGSSPRPMDNPIYFDECGEYAWVRISDITSSEKYLYKTELRLSKAGQDASICIKPDEIILSIIAPVGIPIITQIKCCIHDGFVWLAELEQNWEYIYYLLSGNKLYEEFINQGTRINLNTDTIGNIVIPVPPIIEQQAIVGFIERETTIIDAVIDRSRRHIGLLREYRISLISAAVMGRIDVREAE